MFNKSNMKCLIFPGAGGTSASIKGGSLGTNPGSATNNPNSDQQRQQNPHHSLLQSQNMHLMSSLENNQLNQDEFIWEAPQLSQYPPHYLQMASSLHNRSSIEEGLDLSQQNAAGQSGNLGNINFSPENVSPALAAMLLSNPNLSLPGYSVNTAGGAVNSGNVHQQQQQGGGPQSSANEFDLNADDFNPTFGPPRVPLRRPISSSPSTRGGGKTGGNSTTTTRSAAHGGRPQPSPMVQQSQQQSCGANSQPTNQPTCMSPIAFNQQLLQQGVTTQHLINRHSNQPNEVLSDDALCTGIASMAMSSGGGSVPTHGGFVDYNAMAKAAARLLYHQQLQQQQQYAVASALPKHESPQCELEHQMESLSNFGDNCSSKSRSSRRHRRNSGGGTSSGGRTRSSKRSGSHVATSSRRSHSRHHHHGAGTAGGLGKSNRRLGGSMSSVSTRSHRSKRRAAANGHGSGGGGAMSDHHHGHHQSSRSCDKRQFRKDHQRSVSEKDPLATFNILSSPISPASNTEDPDTPSCDCSCARKLSDLEKRLESFRVAVLEEMQYSLEYNNSRWAKFDKRFVKELRNMRDFFEFRYETARLECEQKLEAKAAAEKDAFVLELTAAENRMKSTTIHLIQNSYIAAGFQKRSLTRRLSLPDIASLKKDMNSCITHYDVINPQTTNQQTNAGVTGGVGQSYEPRTTPLSSDGGGGGGGLFTRDSGIFDASHSSNASNHNCSSSDVSSPLSHNTIQSNLQPHQLTTQTSLGGAGQSGTAAAASEKRRSFSHHTYSSLSAEPANIQPQSRLNFVALGQ
ncbi:uncharacterized protein LOC142345689 isoform X2 [Convolutriloba macropyga]|uniref:uncharacterized protein LOC142345689 isoform X2 n=1 Tax=Convolutriloba macropyga TaxID=536237 RepID=UPI003F51BAEF